LCNCLKNWKTRVERIKIKVKLKVTVEEARKAQSGVQVELYSFFNLGLRRGWVVNATPRPLYPREKDLVPIV
jgi:hypothetical protein